MTRKQRRRLGEILVKWGVVTQSGVDEALEHAKGAGLRIGEALIALGLADEEDVTKALATQYDMEYIDLDRNVVVPTDLHLIPDDIIKRHLVLPLGRENDKLKIVITDPLDLETLDMSRFRLNFDLEPCLASKSKMRNYVEQFIRSDMSLDHRVHLMEQDERDGDGDERLDEDSAPIIDRKSVV